jgi:hypothetical protein
LVTVRLTEAEYNRLRDHCEMKGARSLSEYTRHHLIQMLVPPDESAISIGDDLTTIVTRLHQLRSVIRELQHDIDRVCGEPDGGRCPE